MINLLTFASPEISFCPGPLLAYTAEDGWHLGIGDPSFMGWFTVVAYFVGAFLCWQRSRAIAVHSQPANIRRSRILFWRFLTFTLIVLGTNKQLDLQTWFTLFAKEMAQNQGWYEYRRIVQVIFILGIAIVGFLTLATLLWLTRKTLRQDFLALMGILFLGCFVLVRASSFHHVDQMLGFRIAGLKVNWILELSGIGCVIFAAWRNSRTTDAPVGNAVPGLG